MTPVAPRIVNHVSCVTKINHESHFSWQMHYLVETSSKNCKNRILKALSLSLSPSKCKTKETSKYPLSLSLKVQKCENPQSVVSLSLSISLSLSQSAKLWKPQSTLSLSECKSVKTLKVLSLSLSQSAKLWKPQSSLSLSNMKYEVNM